MKNREFARERCRVFQTFASWTIQSNGTLMNHAQSYAPPRLVAIIAGAIVLAFYQVYWRDVLMTGLPSVDTVAQPLSVLLSFVIGYGLAMLFWLIKQTRGQIWDTFRPTRGRLIAAFVVAMLMPVFVVSYVPWILGGLLAFVPQDEPLLTAGIALAATALAYPITAMIVRHTYRRLALRFGLFCLMFWTGYSACLLVFGAVVFRI